MQMSPVRQAELHSDLKIQEKDELQWKKIKVEGLDENGEKEAQLRRNFNGESIFSTEVNMLMCQLHFHLIYFINDFTCKYLSTDLDNHTRCWFLWYWQVINITHS